MFVALAAVLVIATTALAMLHLRGVADAVGPDVDSLAKELRRLAVDERRERLASRAKADTFEARLAEALEGIDDEAGKVAATNEALGDLALLLESRGRWSPAAVRIVLFGGFLLAALSLIRHDIPQACGVLGLGALGVAVAAIIGGRAREREKAQRRAADELVEAVVPGAPREASIGRRFKDRA